MENNLTGPSGFAQDPSSSCFLICKLYPHWALLVSVFQLGSVNEKSQCEIWVQGEEVRVCCLYSLLVKLLGPLSLLNEGRCSSQGHFLYSFSFPVLVIASIPDPFTNSLGLATARLLRLVMGYRTIPMLPLWFTHSENLTLLLSATTLTNATQIQTQTVLTQYKHKQTHS